MPEVFVLLSIGLGLLLVLGVLLFSRIDHLGSLVPDQFYKSRVDFSGNVSSLQFDFQKTKSILPTEFSLRITGVYGFGLGVLAGLSIALLGLNLSLFPHLHPVGSVIWTFAWLVSVGVVWSIVFLIERHTIRKMIEAGAFERLVDMGVDPVRIAGEIFLRSRSFWTWSFVIAWIGVAVASPLTASGPAIALLMLKMTEKRSRTRAAAARTVHPKELHKQLVTSGRYLLDGGWVTPAGMLLLMAALALAHFGRGEILVLSGCITGFIFLVMWSERASRSSANMHTIEEWRRIFRKELGAPTEQAEIEPIY